MRLHAPGVHEIHPFESLRAFGAELLRRRVIHTALWYIGGCAACLQSAQVILQQLGISTAILTPLLILAIFGLPVALILSWEFDVFAARRGDERQRQVWSSILPVLGVASVCAFCGWIVWSRHYRTPAAPLVAEVSPAHVAVLPFTTTSRNPALADAALILQQRLIDGLTTASQNRSGNKNRLTVLSLDAIRPYTAGMIKLDSIRENLRVGTVLSGRLEGSRDVVRVHLNIVDTRTGDQLDATTIERPAGDLLGLTEALSDSVLFLVRQRLGVTMQARLGRIETRDEKAFDLFNAGSRRLSDVAQLQSDSGGARQALDEADGFFRQASSRDPHWVEPLIGRATVARSRFMLLTSFGRREYQYLHDAIALLDRALEIRPDAPAALELRGRVRSNILSYQKGLTAMDRAELIAAAQRDLLLCIAASPAPATCNRLMGEVAHMQDRVQEAYNYAEKAFNEDPYLQLKDVAPVVLRLFEWSYELERDSLAESWCRQGRRHYMNVTFDDCLLRLAAWSDRVQLNPDSAYALMQHELRLYNDGPVPTSFKARLAAMYSAVLVKNRQPKKARAVLAEARRFDRLSGGSLAAQAGAYALLGSTDSALLTVRLLLANTEVYRRGAVMQMPELRALRSNPTFQHLFLAD